MRILIVEDEVRLAEALAAEMCRSHSPWEVELCRSWY